MICEDERLIAEDITVSLRGRGYEVLDIVSSGEEAVRSAAELKPDLILMDIKLRGEINGIEAVEKIHAFLDVPVVYLTAYAEADVLEGAKRTEPYGYLSKPVGMMELGSTVELAIYKHKADKRVKESEERFQMLAENVDLAVCEVTLDGKLLHANPAMARLAEYKDVQDILSAPAVNLWANPCDREFFLSQLLEQGRVKGLEISGRTKTGSARWLRLNSTVRKDKGGSPSSYFSIVEDITERKNNEEALKESERRYRELVETVSDGIVQTNCLGTVTFANKAYCRMLGFTMEEMIGKSILDFQAPDSKSEEMRAYLDYVCREKPVPTPWFGNHRTRDGGLIFVQADWNYRLDHQGHVIGFISIVKDITERMQAEEERDRILKMSYDLICVAGTDGYFKYVNPSWERVLGYTRDELLSRPFLDFIYSQDHDKNAEEVRKLESGQTILDFENRYVHRDGSIRTIQWTAAPLMEKGLMYCVGRDITERKKNEEALLESERRFRDLYENLRDGMAEVDERGRFVRCNSQFLEMLGYSFEELVGFTYEEVTPTCWHAMESRIGREQVDVRGYSDLYEKEYIRKNRTVIPVEMQTYLIKDHNRQNAGYWAFVRDVTDRKNAEEQIKKSLREKEILLREVHHRVKNNLSVVNSLLRLQSKDARDEFHRQMFEDAQDRIRSMALAHERLCQSDDLASVNMNEYVSGLVDHLVQTQKGISSTVIVEKHVESVHLGLDRAVPLGFLINELVSNVLKHAYTNQAQGTLYISFRLLDEKEYELVVKDDGTGFPEGVDFENPQSLGLSLVKLFTKQINGEIELLRDTGTEFRIRFSNRPS